MWQGASVAPIRKFVPIAVILAVGSVVGALLQVADAADSPRPRDRAGADQTATPRPSAERPSAKVASTKPRRVARAAYKRLNPRERVGQLFMTGLLSTDVARHDVRELRDGRGGNVFVFGNDSRGRAEVRRVAMRLRAATAHRGVRPFVGVDQEGGLVQRLKGPGFSRIPTALQQGRRKPARLRHDARQWGRQLRAAGFNLNLAPVADTVPASVGTRNKPIGALHREYGHTPRRVRTHVRAFVRGMDRADIQTAVKHFPGLGRASGNTDRRRRVTDPTHAGGRYLTPYRAGTATGARFVMVSSAIYPHIDPGTRACFSKRIMRGLLREDQGFHGIVVSDSLSAASVNWLSPGTRAIRFFRAGGTMALDTAASRLPGMVHAVRSEMRHDRHFAKLIRRDVVRVLRVKAREGLIG
jgi:beta-N-acetylhexosaminidase